MIGEGGARVCTRHVCVHTHTHTHTHTNDHARKGLHVSLRVC